MNKFSKTLSTFMLLTLVFASTQGSATVGVEKPVGPSEISKPAQERPIDFLIGKTWESHLHDGGVLTVTYINDHRILFTSRYGDSTAVIFNLKIQPTAVGYKVTESARADAADGVYAETNAGEQMTVKKIDDKTIIITINGSMPFVYNLMAD